MLSLYACQAASNNVYAIVVCLRAYAIYVKCSIPLVNQILQLFQSCQPLLLCLLRHLPHSSCGHTLCMLCLLLLLRDPGLALSLQLLLCLNKLCCSLGLQPCPAQRLDVSTAIDVDAALMLQTYVKARRTVNTMTVCCVCC